MAVELIPGARGQLHAMRTHVEQLLHCRCIRFDNRFQIRMQFVKGDEPVVSLAAADMTELVMRLLVMQWGLCGDRSFGHLVVKLENPG